MPWCLKRCPMRCLKGVWFALLFGTLLAACGVETSQAVEDRYVLPWIRLVPEKPADMESNQCLFETYSYYTTYKRSENDLAAFGAIFKMDIGKGWEVRTFGDLLSWQYPAVGFGDITVGTKWNFLKEAFSAAVALDLQMPTGGVAFREPGFEPTLSLMASRKAGPFEPSCTLSSTYAAGGAGENYYFSYQLSLGLDYAPTKHHSIGIFAVGYTPASADDRGPRLSAGANYTFTRNDSNSYSFTLTKGLSERGQNWTVGLSYDYYFEIPTLFRSKRATPDRNES